MSTRDRILDAARLIFVRYGYRLASMEAVAQEAGLSRQAVYHHFATKELLFRAGVEAMSEDAHAISVAEGQRAEAAGGGLAQVLTAQIAGRLEYFSRLLKVSPHADELMSEHHRQTLDLHQAYLERSLALSQDTIERFTARGAALAPGVTPAELARCLQIAELGAKANLSAAPDFSELACIISLVTRGALAAPPAPRSPEP